MSDEMFKAVIESGQTAIKSALLINGGAATALLAVMAEAFKSPGSELRALAPALGWAWLLFVVGLGFAGSSSGARYLSQHFYGQAEFDSAAKSPMHTAAADVWRRVAVTLALGSFALFFVGAGLAFSAFRP